MNRINLLGLNLGEQIYYVTVRRSAESLNALGRYSDHAEIRGLINASHVLDFKFPSS